MVFQCKYCGIIFEEFNAMLRHWYEAHRGWADYRERLENGDCEE